MSHYSVLVLSKEGQSVEGLLDPFYEGEGEDFRDKTEEVIERYNDDTDLVTALQDKDGNLYIPGTCPVAKKSETKEIKVKPKDIYTNIEDFARFYYDYTITDHGAIGYYYNKNAKWDWYEIGGRWENCLKTKDGKQVNSCKLKDLDLEGNKEEYNRYLRFWELHVEKEKEELTEDEKKELGFVLYKKEYYIQKYKTKENYAKINSMFSTYAVLDNESNWHEPGKMGWFGCSFASPEDEGKWEENYYELLNSFDGDLIVTLVDCHI